jgi:ribonucleoside-diphosphate reductase alpha chain
LETISSSERSVASPTAPATPAVSSSHRTAPAPGAAPAQSAQPSSAQNAPHSTAELIEAQQGRTADAPLCLTCGTKMRPAGSCYVCEGCGSTSGCS